MRLLQLNSLLMSTTLAFYSRDIVTIDNVKMGLCLIWSCIQSRHILNADAETIGSLRLNDGEVRQQIVEIMREIKDSLHDYVQLTDASIAVVNSWTEDIENVVLKNNTSSRLTNEYVHTL